MFTIVGDPQVGPTSVGDHKLIMLLMWPPSQSVKLRGPSVIQIIESSPCFLEKRHLCLYL